MRRVAAVPIATAVGFVVLLVAVSARWRPLERLDLAVSEAFRDHGQARPGWVTVMRIITDLGDTLPLAALGLVVGTTLAVRGQRRSAWRLAAVCLPVLLLWSVMHGVVPRTRPVEGFVDVAAYAFPSGHTSNATVAATLTVWLLWPRLGRPGRVITVAVAGAYAATIGLSRVALLAHWPSDVLGGWLLGLAVFSTVTILASISLPGRLAPEGVHDGPERE